MAFGTFQIDFGFHLVDVYLRMSEDLLPRQSLLLIELQHLLYQLPQLLRTRLSFLASRLEYKFHFSTFFIVFLRIVIVISLTIERLSAIIGQLVDNRAE